VEEDKPVDVRTITNGSPFKRFLSPYDSELPAAARVHRWLDNASAVARFS
jgi:hypothetical protein